MTELNIKCLISGKDTDGRIAVFEEIVAPGAGPPRHTHRTQVEVFHVIEGTLRFEIGGETKDVGSG
ncbi:MAG: quercetin dioxygenase-like cupin family protein, partial [Candidatus Promineifilaceae bacterium]